MASDLFQKYIMAILRTVEGEQYRRRGVSQHYSESEE